MASLRANRVRYLVSLAVELLSQANRVRDLIGNAHWLTDGHHKEFLLIDLLRRHMPSGMIAARGFVIDPTDETVCSPEQDILIVDTQVEGPVFHQGGVVIAFPRAVRAAVSVKTTCKRETVMESVENLNRLRAVVGPHVPARVVWCGAYYFEPADPVRADPSRPLEYVAAGAAAHPVPNYPAVDSHPAPQGPDLQCTGREFAYRMTHAVREGSGRVSPARVHGYRCGDSATALFLGSLLEHLARARGQADSDFTAFADEASLDYLGGRDLAPIPVP